MSKAQQATTAITKLRETLKKKLEDADRFTQDCLSSFEMERGNALAKFGFKVCPKCNGDGTIERLDASFMRRFGLQDWDGCPSCGSKKRGERGCGFIPK